MAIEHQDITMAQRQMFMELFESGKPNTMVEQSRIAIEALVRGGATRKLSSMLVSMSLEDLLIKGVIMPTRIPWYQP